jgi:hypothetical protein
MDFFSETAGQIYFKFGFIAMLADLRHVVFSLLCLQNAKMQKPELTSSLRVFAFSDFQGKTRKIRSEEKLIYET